MSVHAALGSTAQTAQLQPSSLAQIPEAVRT